MPIFVAGLDLGQLQDYTALVVAEAEGTKRMVTYEGRDRETGLPIPIQRPIEMMPLSRVDVRYVERFPLKTQYRTIHGLLHQRLANVPRPRYFVLDRTGVGVGVSEIFSDLAPIGITFTGAGEASMDTEHSYRVPKRDLIGCAQVLLQNHTLRIAKEAPHHEALVKELLAFRMKISISGHDTYEAWREGDHDDLVNALAMACWTAELIISTNAKAVLDGLQRREEPPQISPY